MSKVSRPHAHQNQTNARQTGAYYADVDFYRRPPDNNPHVPSWICGAVKINERMQSQDGYNGDTEFEKRTCQQTKLVVAQAEILTRSP